jgi:hypothetical protein
MPESFLFWVAFFSIACGTVSISFACHKVCLHFYVLAMKWACLVSKTVSIIISR